MRTLPDVLSLARLVHDAEISGKVLDRDAVKAAFEVVVGDMRGGNGKEIYLELKRAVVSAVEFTAMAERPKEFSTDASILSIDAQARAAKTLNPTLIDFHNYIERTMQVYSLEEETSID